MRVALMGSKQLGLDALAVLREHSDVSPILTIDDRTDMRSRLDQFVAEGAVVSASRGEADAAIRAIDADTVVVAGWYWIIRAEELRRRQFVGIHHSLLPLYRGGAPLVWALIEGQPEVGTTLFTLTEGADEGPVWAQATVPVGDGYIAAVNARCDAAAVALLDVLFHDSATTTEQDHSRATWRPQRHPDDGLINWSLPAREVERWVRAQSRPYPGAFTYAGEDRVSIWRARATTTPMVGDAGSAAGGMVACGDGYGLEIEEASAEIPDGVRFTGARNRSGVSSVGRRR